MNKPFQATPPPVPRKPLFSGLRNSFLTGIVVIAPVGLTVWLIWTVIGWVDGFVLPFVPNSYQPETIIKQIFGEESQMNIRGLGVIFFLVFTTFVGWMAKGFIGRFFIRNAETLVHRMPVVRSIYSGVKQIAETVFAQSDRSFEKACLVQYPRKGIWAVGFISTVAKGEVKSKASPEGQLLSVFVPTTPNPTSGYTLMVPRNKVIDIDVSVDQALKYVISMGVVPPKLTTKNKQSKLKR